MTPFIIHSLGDRMYGFWVFVGTFLGYYGYLDLGLSSAVTRYISRAIGAKNNDEINQILNSSIIVFSIIGIFVLLISAAIILICPYFIHSVSEISLFRKIVALLAISIATGFPIRAFSGVLDANLRYDLSTYAKLIRLLIANILIYILLINSYGIFAIAFASFISGMLESFLIVLFALKTYPAISVNLSLFNHAIIKLLFSYSGKTFVAQMADLLRFRIDTLVIAGYLNVGLITYYSIGSRFVEYFSQIMINATGIMSPVFSQYDGCGEYDKMRERLLEVTQLCVISSLYIGSCIIFYSKYFIARWLGPGYESSYYVCVILCISATIALMQTTSVGLLYGISKHHFYAIANICEGVLNLILSLILVKHYGIYGVALGTAIETVIFKLLIQPVYICKLIHLSFYRFYINTIIITSIKLAVPLLLYYYLISDYIRPQYLSIIEFSFIQFVLFAAYIYFFVMGSNNRSHIRNALGFLTKETLA